MSRLPGALAVLVLAACGVGCAPDLGDAPFVCNRGQPKCPDGYECNPANVCVKEGTCPAGVPGCPAESCGNGTCDPGEDCNNCETDCGQCGGCGDGTCAPDESCETCEADCGKCPATCGNGTCDPGEDCNNCSSDCGQCEECGNGTCDPGETPSNCPLDCPSSTCGDGTCDPGENTTSCPEDCKQGGCTDGETECIGTDSIKYCDKGTFKTVTCEEVCLANHDYALDCKYSAADGKDLCHCGDYSGFGGICNDEIECADGLVCGYFAAGNGFCTKYCDNPDGPCTGGPPGTDPQCILSLGGEDACGFFCDFLFPPCPTGMVCDFLVDQLCKPE